MSCAFDNAWTNRPLLKVTYAPSSLARALILLPILFLLTGCYLTSQAMTFMSHQLRARPTDRAIARWPDYTDFIGLTGRIREFGIEHLGLRETDSYTTFIKFEKDYLAYVVSAAQPTSFDRHIWRYPVVGSLPYKGFYDGAAARREAARLEAAGWETFVRQVGAFSSLGFFTDPLYSYMATYPPERIASLLLHEMTHSTIWIDNDVPLNEAIATFIGDRGALAYLEHRYGMDSPVLSDAMRRQSDRTRFVQFMRHLAGRLEIIFDSGLPRDEILQLRDKAIREEQERFAANYHDWFYDDAYIEFPNRRIDNAFIDLYRTYNADIALIETVYASIGGALADLVSTLAAIPPYDLRAVLESWPTEPSEPLIIEGPALM